MAIAKRFSITHDTVFPHGAYLVSEVSPVADFERSTREQRVQQVDKDSGLLLWQVDVLDADPEAPRASKTMSVKIAAKHQPVPPAPSAGMPFTAVEFTGLTVLAYVDYTGGKDRDGRDRARVAWSLRATGFADASSSARRGESKAAA